MSTLAKNVPLVVYYQVGDCGGIFRRKLELRKICFNFCAAHLPVGLDIKTKFQISNFGQPCQK